MFIYKSLLGALAPETGSQSLLLLDNGVGCLVGCGWDESCTPGKLDLLRKHAAAIDMILLTHPTLAHLGAFAHASKYIPGFDAIPVYATLPVINMGKSALLDLYRSSQTSDRVSEVEIEAAFDRINALKYLQTTALAGRLDGIIITAYNAGHTVGGTIWKVQRDNENIVVAIDWNHSRDRHLSGAALLRPDGNANEALLRPTALICSARNASTTLPVSRKRDEALLESIHRTLEEGGTVLLPCDASARVLELAHLLEQHWQRESPPYPLFLLTRSVNRTLGYARSMIEWMSASIVSEFEGGASPFEFKHLKLCHSLQKIEAHPSAAKVILASGIDLETGFSQQIFASICSSPLNLVVFSQTPEESSLARELLDIWALHAVEDDEGMRGEVEVSVSKVLRVMKSIPMEGGELHDYLQERRTEKQREDERLAMEIKSRTILEEESESESSDDEGDAQGLFARADGQVDVGVAVLLTGDVFDYDVRHAKGRNRMFPQIAQRRRVDAYGEIIHPEDYMRAEEQEEMRHAPESQITLSTGEKRKWDESFRGGRREEGGGGEDDEEPTKIVAEMRDVRIACRVRWLDFEGLHDARSLQMIVPQLQARKIILVHGSEEETTTLAEMLDATPNVTSEIYHPGLDSAVNASVDTQSYDIRLDTTLAKNLVWQKLSSEHAVAHVSGRLVPGEGGMGGYVLEQTEMLRPGSLFVGDMRLAELKRLIGSAGHSAEFRGEGMLLCDGNVLVHKDVHGKILVEGLVSPSFYDVRSFVYSLLAVV